MAAVMPAERQPAERQPAEQQQEPDELEVEFEGDRVVPVTGGIRTEDYFVRSRRMPKSLQKEQIARAFQKEIHLPDALYRPLRPRSSWYWVREAVFTERPTADLHDGHTAPI
jgi:hypothetical protein